MTRLPAGPPQSRSAGSPLKPTMTYLCLQDLAEGSASATHTLEVVRSLQNRGWDVRLHAVRLTPGDRSLLRRLMVMLRVQAVFLWGRVTADAAYIRAHPAALPATLMCRARGIPVLTELNGPVDDVLAAWPRLRSVAGLLRWSMSCQLQASSAVLAVTEGLAQHAKSVGGSHVRTYVVPNAADVARFVPRERALPPYALFFGAFAPWQGLETLLAAARGPEWPGGVRLVIAGDGQQRALVEEAAAAAANVEYIGPVASADVPGLVAEACVVLIPKQYNRSDLGLSPIKLYESMAAGVPVIASDVAGLADVVRRHQCGRVVAPGDASALATAVAALHREPDVAQSLGMNGRRAAVAQHDWSHRAAAIEDAVASTLSGSRRAPGRSRTSALPRAPGAEQNVT